MAVSRLLRMDNASAFTSRAWKSGRKAGPAARTSSWSACVTSPGGAGSGLCRLGEQSRRIPGDSSSCSHRERTLSDPGRHRLPTGPRTHRWHHATRRPYRLDGDGRQQAGSAPQRAGRHASPPNCRPAAVPQPLCQYRPPRPGIEQPPPAHSRPASLTVAARAVVGPNQGLPAPCHPRGVALYSGL